MLVANDERILETTVTELESIHGDGLLAVALYGEAATGSYRPNLSVLSIAVLLTQVTPETLRGMRPYARRWRWRRIGTPLVMDPLYVQTSADVFPLEFLDLKDRHRMLHGRVDPFEEIGIDVTPLRMEVEEQTRGKMLHLWESYLESGRSQRALHRLLLETPPGFTAALRAILFLREEERPDETAALLESVETVCDVALPTFKRLERARAGDERIARREVESVFSSYFDEVRTLVGVADKL